MRIKELRKLMGIKQQSFAKDMHVSQPTVSDWENGNVNPSIENLISLSQYFGVSIGCIIGTEPIPEGYPDLTYYPISHEQVIKDQRKAAAEGRIMNPDFQPAYTIGNNQPDPGMAAKEKAPFTREQAAYLEEMEDRIVAKMTAALREDTSSLSEKDAK